MRRIVIVGGASNQGVSEQIKKLIKEEFNDASVCVSKSLPGDMSDIDKLIMSFEPQDIDDTPELSLPVKKKKSRMSRIEKINQYGGR